MKNYIVKMFHSTMMFLGGMLGGLILLVIADIISEVITGSSWSIIRVDTKTFVVLACLYMCYYMMITAIQKIRFSLKKKEKAN